MPQTRVELDILLDLRAKISGCTDEPLAENWKHRRGILISKQDAECFYNLLVEAVRKEVPVNKVPIKGPASVSVKFG